MVTLRELLLLPVQLLLDPLPHLLLLLLEQLPLGQQLQLLDPLLLPREQPPRDLHQLQQELLHLLLQDQQQLQERLQQLHLLL